MYNFFESAKLLALRALLPHVLQCPTCLACSRALCPTCLVPYVLSCVTFLVPYVFSCLTCFAYSCTSSVLCLTCSRSARALNSMCSYAPRPSLTSGVSSLTCSYASHVLKLSCLVPFVLLVLQLSEFLQPGLRLIIVIDSSKDAPNIHDINTLHLLQVATHTKNEFRTDRIIYKQFTDRI